MINILLVDDHAIVRDGLRRIIKPSDEELQFHKKYLKDQLQKNYFD